MCCLPKPPGVDCITCKSRVESIWSVASFGATPDHSGWRLDTLHADALSTLQYSYSSPSRAWPPWTTKTFWPFSLPP